MASVRGRRIRMVPLGSIVSWEEGSPPGPPPRPRTSLSAAAFGALTRFRAPLPVGPGAPNTNALPHHLANPRDLVEVRQIVPRVQFRDHPHRFGSAFRVDAFALPLLRREGVQQPD